MTQRSGWDLAPNWMSLILSPEELDATITSGGSSSSSCPYSFCLKSIRSGPFSWTRSTPATACARSAVNLRFDCDAPGDRPNRLSAGQALSTNLRSEASAFGAGSVATTCNPLARKSEAQLAPITPVPMIAMRRMGLVLAMSCLRSDFGVGDAGEIALGIEEVALVLAIEIGGIDRAGEVGDEHAVAGNIKCDADALHQMRDHNLRVRLCVDQHTIDGVAARRIAAVGPVEDTVRQIELEVDGFRQMIEQHLDVGAVRRGLTLRDLDVGAEDAAQPALRCAFLSPVDFTKLRIDGDADAPAGFIEPVLVATAAFDERFDLRAVEIGAHHAHALAVAPIELAVLLIEVKLLRRVGAAWRDDDLAIPSIEVGALDRTVVERGNAHVGPVDVTSLDIHGDAVGEAAIGDNGRAVGTIGIHRVNAVPAQFENEQSAGADDAR